MSDHPISARIGDSERDEAVSMLREHLTAGRLDATEFEERMQAALGARTREDLAPLFEDLPDPRPGATGEQRWAQPNFSPTDPSPIGDSDPGRVPAIPEQRGTGVAPSPGPSSAFWNTLQGVLWPAAILGIILTGHWWFIFLPMIISPLIASQAKVARTRERRQRELGR